MTLTPDASNELLMLLACSALEGSELDVRLFMNHELLYYGRIVQVDMLADTVTIEEIDSAKSIIRPDEFNRIEIY